MKDKISDGSDMVWTHYDTAKELRDELELPEEYTYSSALFYETGVYNRGFLLPDT